MLTADSRTISTRVVFASLLGFILLGGATRPALAVPPPASATPSAASLSEPAALIRLAASTPATASAAVQILLDETRLEFDAAGRLSRTDRLVYRIDLEDRASDWSTSSVSWSPWFQHRPRLEAQVIAKSGQVHPLDPATVSEASVPSDDPTTFTDDRALTAPLPAVEVGSIIEEVRTVRDSALTIDAGRTLRLFVARQMPVRSRRITVDLPVELAFQYRFEKLSGTNVERSTSAGRLKIVFTVESPPVLESVDAGLPSDVPRYPAIILSTGQSWERVVERYREMIEPRITDDPDHAAVRSFAAVSRGDSRVQLSRNELIERLIRRLHREVRYTGVELGQAAIRPGFPSQSLKRRYGDCKDKSLLLVALLRELGVPAELALVSAGPGLDVVPDLPGWGVFDHAVVHVPGPPELWIDATDAFSRVGQVPSGDLGRLALPIAPGTKALIAIPMTTSADNRIVETREFFLSETDPVRVVETSDLQGEPEANFREGLGQLMASNLKSQMESYAREVYLAKGAVTATTSRADDFSRPFQLVVTALDARRGYATLKEAGLIIPRLGLFNRLPSDLTEFDPDSLANPAYTRNRTTDLVLALPTTVEWHYRIVPPTGYRPDPLPDTLTQSFGPVLLHQEFAADSNGVVTGHFLLDPQVARFKPSDTRAFRAKLAEFSREKQLEVKFHHEGLGLIGEGRLSEGIQWLKRAVERDPKRASPHMRMSQGLLEAGMGEAARLEARTATQLAPKDAAAHENLAEVLSHDLLGRLHRRGFDPAGAGAAYHKAIELDHDNKRLAVGLAILEEFNASGVRYGPGARLGEAIQLYRGLTDDELNQYGMLWNLPIALEKVGRFAELEEWTRGPRDVNTFLALRLVAIAGQRGGAAAVAEANRATSDDGVRGTALLAAGTDLISMRRYADAAGLTDAGSRGRDNAAALLARAEFFRRLQKYDPARYPASDARGVFFKLYSRLLAEDPVIDSVTVLFARHIREGLTSPEGKLGFQQAARVLRSVTRNANLPPEGLVDILASSADIRTEGDPAVGMRLRMTTPGGGDPQSAFLKQEGGAWVIVNFAFSNAMGPSGLGHEAADALERGNPAAARQWLDWSKESVLSTPTDSLGTPPFYVFNRTTDPPDPERLKLAAAALLMSSDSVSARRSLALARSSRAQKLSPEETEAAAIMRAVAFVNAGMPDSAIAAIHELQRRHSGSQFLFGLEMKVYSDLKDIEGARTAAEAWLKRFPEDDIALRQLLMISGLRKDVKDVLAYGHRLDALQKLTPMDLNNWAWYELSCGALTDSTLGLINRSIYEGKTSTFAALHTQSCIYAELNRTREARDILYQAMDEQGLDDPDGTCWYVLGRMAEQYGLPQAAREAYLRVGSKPQAFGMEDSVHELADAGLNRLRAKPRRK